MEVSGQLHTSTNLPMGKERLASIEQEAGWAHSQSGHFAEDAKKTCSCE